MSAAERVDGALLLRLAREAVAAALERGSGEAPDSKATAWLTRPGACFVTLKRGHALRGCIGSLRPYRPLAEDVHGNARAAAFSDGRFSPVTGDELDELTFEVSLLSPMEEVPAATEREVHERLRPFVDGVSIEHGRRRGVFLPQVWESYPGRTLFLRRLRQKAGLEADFWAPDMRCWRFTVSSWEEAAPGRPPA